MSLPNFMSVSSDDESIQSIQREYCAYLSTVNGKVFKEMFDPLKRLSNTVNIVWTKQGLSITDSDGEDQVRTFVCMTMPTKSFERYYCAPRNSGASIRCGVNIVNIIKALSGIQNNSILGLYVLKDNPTEMGIVEYNENSRKINQTFIMLSEVKLCARLGKTLSTPVVVDMVSKQFSQNIKKLNGLFCASVKISIGVQRNRMILVGRDSHDPSVRTILSITDEKAVSGMSLTANASAVADADSEESTSISASGVKKRRKNAVSDETGTSNTGKRKKKSEMMDLDCHANFNRHTSVGRCDDDTDAADSNSSANADENTAASDGEVVDEDPSTAEEGPSSSTSIDEVAAADLYDDRDSVETDDKPNTGVYPLRRILDMTKCEAFSPKVSLSITNDSKRALILKYRSTLGEIMFMMARVDATGGK